MASMGADDRPVPSDLVQLGKVLAAHGVRGGLKIQPYSPDAQVLLNSSVWWLATPDSQPHSPAMGQEDGEKWTAAAALQPTTPKPGSLLGDAGVSSLSSSHAAPLSGPAPRAVRVRSSRLHAGQSIVAQFVGIDDRNAAEGLRGSTIWASRASFPDPGDDEYYWVDLIGCDFYGQQDGTPCFLGRVGQVLDNGAHAVLDVLRGQGDGQGGFHPQPDARGRPVHTLVPFVGAHVHHVDIIARRITSDWPADF